MSYNPVLARDTISGKLVPYGRLNEIFVLERPKIKATITVDKKPLVKENASVVVTSQRVVIILTKAEKSIQSIELPYSHLSGPSGSETPAFQQPILGANKLVGICHPDANNQYSFPKTVEWTLTFVQGECSVFLQAFLGAFYEAKKQMASNPHCPIQPDYFSNMTNQYAQQTAYRDPADPTMFFVSQPVYNSSPQSNTAGFNNEAGLMQNPSYGAPPCQSHPYNAPGGNIQFSNGMQAPPSPYQQGQPPYASMGGSAANASPYPAYGQPWMNCPYQNNQPGINSYPNNAQAGMNYPPNQCQYFQPPQQAQHPMNQCPQPTDQYPPLYPPNVILNQGMPAANVPPPHYQSRPNY